MSKIELENETAGLGTCYQGVYVPKKDSFEKTVAKLITLYGISNVLVMSAVEKSSVDVTLRMSDREGNLLFTLYDWKCDMELRIGGSALDFTPHDLDRIKAALDSVLKDTTPTEYYHVADYDGAEEAYGYSRGENKC